jgi:hypothetical protein
MSASISNNVQAIIDRLISGPDEQRKQSLVELALLADADKSAAASQLRDSLSKKQDSSSQGWYLSALATVGLAEDKQALLAYMNRKNSTEEYIRGRWGETGTQAARSQRNRVAQRYTEKIDDLDKQVVTHINNLTSQARIASTVSIVTYAVLLAVGLTILILGLWALFNAANTTGGAVSISIGIVVASSIIVMLLFYRNPLDRIRRSAAGFVQVNVAFLGYIRQIHQIDLVFKQMFIADDKLDPVQVSATIEQIRNAVEHTVEEVKAYLTPD